MKKPTPLSHCLVNFRRKIRELRLHLIIIRLQLRNVRLQITLKTINPLISCHYYISYLHLKGLIFSFKLRNSIKKFFLSVHKRF